MSERPDYKKCGAALSGSVADRITVCLKCDQRWR